MIEVFNGKLVVALIDSRHRRLRVRMDVTYEGEIGYFSTYQANEGVGFDNIRVAFGPDYKPA